MSESKNDFSAIRIGTRIRHTADGAIGRIIWANATTVKVQWEDGEKINWKRAELAEKGLEILDDEQAAEDLAKPRRRPRVRAAHAGQRREQTRSAAERAARRRAVGQLNPRLRSTCRHRRAEPAATSGDRATGRTAKKRRARRRTRARKEKKTSAMDAAARVLSAKTASR